MDSLDHDSKQNFGDEKSVDTVAQQLLPGFSIYTASEDETVRAERHTLWEWSRAAV